MPRLRMPLNTQEGWQNPDALKIDEINRVSRYFANYGSLQAHDPIEEVAGTQVPSDDDDLGTIEGLKCQDCEIQFWRPYDSLAHKEGVHSQIGSYVCVICDAKFSKIYVLTEHITNFCQLSKADDEDQNPLIKTEMVEEEVYHYSQIPQFSDKTMKLMC